MIRILIFLIVLLVPFALSAQGNPISTEQFLEELDHSISRLLHDFAIPGASLAMIEDGEIAEFIMNDTGNEVIHKCVRNL